MSQGAIPKSKGKGSEEITQEWGETNDTNLVVLEMQIIWEIFPFLLTHLGK